MSFEPDLGHTLTTGPLTKKRPGIPHHDSPPRAGRRASPGLAQYLNRVGVLLARKKSEELNICQSAHEKM